MLAALEFVCGTLDDARFNPQPVDLEELFDVAAHIFNVDRATLKRQWLGLV